jgi:A/G-specific adenine glycosylase
MTRTVRDYPEPVRASTGQSANPERAAGRIRQQVLAWFAREQRDLPWRRTREPWAVLVSEVMLQQTQASRVADRFPPFLARFPTAEAMAAASEAEVLAAWSGLGYNRRALGLRHSATAICASGWPRDPASLERLPGVGRYTARAVAAIAFGCPIGAVDTNVRRWLVRRFGLATDVRPAELQAIADRLAAGARPKDASAEAADWMHASMEFGARICSARQPACSQCPIRRGCPARGVDRHVPVGRQPRFAGSQRAHRGSVLRALSKAPGHQLTMDAASRLVGSDGAATLDGLERDGLAHRAGARLMLGGRDGDPPPTTIER